MASSLCNEAEAFDIAETLKNGIWLHAHRQEIGPQTKEYYTFRTGVRVIRHFRTEFNIFEKKHSLAQCHEWFDAHLCLLRTNFVYTYQVVQAVIVQAYDEMLLCNHIEVEHTMACLVANKSRAIEHGIMLLRKALERAWRVESFEPNFMFSIAWLYGESTPEEEVISRCYMVKPYQVALVKNKEEGRRINNVG